ncbi:DNA-binding transcriptional regulator, MarR family [Sulfitobacter brevis]|uniref:DNA-binding transcriptional regulator, MarR family n=1 Tax=Sulfitobacter brevis TaxID=74348 RepID=A0A1I1W0B9_9RHOB|nr:MarR family winged helix-turn-helix transcriptional regulator [Sulfitobacter brevis]SFD88627.1 DNA-binding transcriptional regulator, MarR family [Sulfitobacter brevis]
MSSESDATLPCGGADSAKHPPVETIEDVISFKIKRLNGLIDRRGFDWLEALFDLSLNEWRVLALIRSKGPVRAGDLSGFLLMDKSQLSRLLKELIGKRLISSNPDRQDARAVVLRVTTKGKALYGRILGEVVRRNERVLTPLTAGEAALFNGMLDRVIAFNLSRTSDESDPANHE